jgi:hypothetical protein
VPDPAVHVASVPTGGKPLTAVEWTRVERLLDDWKAEVLAAARKHPARSYKLGFAQIEAFAKLLDGVPGSALRQVAFGGIGPTAKAAEKWMQTYTLHELDDSLNVYVGKIKDALLYGLRHQVNPQQIASWLYQATQDARVNWQLIARTEMVRANAVGRLHACKEMGFDRVWVPPHVGSCKSCKRLLENQVFSIDELLTASNYGRPQGEWVACVPLHPRCRHGYLPYVAEVYEDAMEHYAGLEQAGLTDEDRLDELFDSSGQLRAGAVLEDHERAAIAWKTRDPWTEGLLLAVSPMQRQNSKVRQLLGEVHKVNEDKEHSREALRLDALMPALHQRPVDPAKILAYRQRLVAGETPPPIEVHRWPDGRQWIENGQHRAWAARLAGHHTIDALVHVVAHPWESMEDVARDLLGKVLDPRFIDRDSRILHHEVAKVPTSLDGILLGPVVDTRYIDERSDPHDLPQIDGETGFALPPSASMQEAAYSPPLDPLLFDGLRLREDVGMALEQWWRYTAGDDWTSWSWLFMPAHARVPVVLVDYNRLRAARKAFAKFSDEDLHFALVALIAQHRGDRELAPGLPLDVRILPLQPAESDGSTLAMLAAFAPGPLWYVDGVSGAPAMWVNGEPDSSEPEELAKTFPDYTLSEATYSRADHARPLTFTNTTLAELEDRLLSEDEFVAKQLTVAKMSPAANTGVEHWITVHPHGDAEKGQPVLVRNNTDGTMTVIGGAGGSMNYMRLDPKRRITSNDTKARDKEAGAKAAAGLGGHEQTVTEEERERQEQEFKHNQAQARATMDKADGKIADLTQQLHALVADQIGAKWLTHGLIRHADGSTEEYELGFMERKQALRKLIAGALQTLAVGRIDNRDAEDAPYLFTERHGDFENMPDAEGASPEASLADDPADAADDAAAREENAQSDPEAEAEAERKINRRLPPLDEDQAQSVMELEREIARWRRVKSKARAITQTGKSASSAYAMEWSDANVTDAVRERVQQEKRTIAARDLLGVADKNTFKVTYDRAFQQGATDAIDSFTHAVLGRSALSPETIRLLGPMGAAQMVARVIADRASAVGDPDKLSLEKVRGALDELKQRLEGEIATRSAARARLAMDTAIAMTEEERASAKGQSLWTETAARSYRAAKYKEAANTLGMSIAGLQAISSLETALEHPPEKITVGGGDTPAELLGLAQRAKITLKADQITKSGRGSYSAEIPAEALTHLFDFEKPLDFEHQERLKAIRTGKGLQRQIEANRSTPGMADQLGPAQAQGKMFLLATQPPNTKRHWNLTGTPIEKKSEDLRAQMSLGDTLDFAPGVGKTHTGIAAAMQLMHDEPHMNHRVLVTCPATALAGWAHTVKKQGSKTAQIMGMEATYNAKGELETRSKSGRAFRQAQRDTPADFNIISHEQLAKDPSIAHKLGATIVIADEAQKFKNTGNQRSGALKDIGDSIDVSRGDVMSRTAWQDRFGGTPTGKPGLESGYEHLTREDRVRQFRESQLDGHLFHMDAASAGNDLPEREAGNENPFDGHNDDRGYLHHEVTLDPEHREHVQQTVQRVNEMQKESKAAGGAGLPFGGAPIIDKAVLDRPGNAFAKTAAKVMAERLQGTHDWKGFQDHPAHPDGAHAGSYAKKGVIFNEGVQELRHLIPELEKQGVKVFSTVRKKSGDAWESVGHEDNEDVQKAYLAHKGPCVLVTTDRNSTARSWQFGDNNGRFQHGGTEFMHYSLPDKGGNATIAQREARIHRRGAQVPVAYHKLVATDLPTAKRQHDRLTRERKAQQMGGNSEQLVGGKETMRHRLDRAGVAPANQLQTKDEREAARAATTGTSGDTDGKA